MAEKKNTHAAEREDQTVMAAVRTIIGKGNDAEIRAKKDGTLKVIEVKKNTKVG